MPALTNLIDELNTSKFKEQCLALLDHLEPEGILITRHDKPLARLMPVSSSCADLIGSMKGSIQIKGDLMSTGMKWDAES